MRPIFVLIFFVTFFSSCKRQATADVDDQRPRREIKEYFDKKYLLYKLAGNYYDKQVLNQTIKADKPSVDIPAIGIHIDFKPLGYADSLNLQYTHVYSKNCVYHTNDSTWKYAEVSFPNTCLTNDFAYAKVRVQNSSNNMHQLFFRVFYQNTSYWYPTDSLSAADRNYLQNYYGASRVIECSVPANFDTTLSIPYNIGMNAKHEFDFDPAKDPARPGNYEFMLLTTLDASNALTQSDLDLKKVNPFTAISHQTQSTNLESSIGYVGPHHFKFVFLDEYFDGANDLNPNHVYIAKNGKEKKLCDTCSGWYRAVINEHWNTEAYFKGFISKAPFVKAEYGIRRQNCKIDSAGINLTIPASKRAEYKKTWGEFLFGPSFKYGHLTVRAKFAQMFDIGGGTNGIIHNLWLYQRDPDPIDTTNPYHFLQNGKGAQPYEIDFEVWSSLYGINTMWDDQAFINYSIVDYMRNPNVQLKPGEFKMCGSYKAERLNKRQAGVPGKELNREYFNYFHTYELYWFPDHVRFLVDGAEQAIITKDMASIPDKYMFLWIGSPLYQDGIYYSQSNIPFLKYDKHTIIDYIKIE
jgi:hypothetical protein